MVSTNDKQLGRCMFSEVNSLRIVVRMLINSGRNRQILARSRLLRENGQFLTRQGFLMRKHYFNNPESGFFCKTKRKVQPRNPLTDPTMVTDMMKGNIVNVLPMILVGGWINWAFSGFVATKVPFPLTLRFKPMLQRGIDLPSLDPSWVSSASWYFLNVFGLRRMYNLILGEDTEQNQLLLQDQFLSPVVPAPPEPNKAFKAEWEALELVSHHWALQDVEEQLMSQNLKLAGMFGPD
ncbi:ER membrane protein complex subunit 3-like isoform X2 [Hemicordylus capensis]|uniref:ER membrane protein complex subunit 3-like isoform X2 n=1 Tax=Hemicordylus capensis TaxID=884348 RepID=UPI002304A074|nr:ER membrane protein complex subunit 3-like isoform X2 [Hemicordylus capensis]